MRRFFDDMVRVREQMSPDMAERMTGIGTDLIVARIAERQAQETHRPAAAP